MQAHFSKCRFKVTRPRPPIVQPPQSSVVHCRVNKPSINHIQVLPDWKDFQISYHKLAKLLLCSRCHVCIRVEELSSHLQNQHHLKSSHDPPSVLQDPPQDIYNQSNPITPFGGVKMYMGLVCQVCFYACIQQETMHKHFVKFHNGAWKQSTLQGWVQTLLQHQHRQFFHVLPSTVALSPPPPDQPAIPNRAALLDRLPPPITLESFIHAGHQNIRDTAPWLKQTGILLFVQRACAAGMDHSQLATVIPDAPLPRFGYIHTAVFHWLEVNSPALYNISQHLRVRVTSTKIPSEIGNKPMSPLANTSTIRNYATICAQYLVFCLQVTQNAFPNLPRCLINPLAKTLLTKLHDLKDASQPVPSQLITEILMALIIQVNPYGDLDTSFHLLQFVALRMIKPDDDNDDNNNNSNLVVILDKGLDNNLDSMWNYITEGLLNSPFWALRSWMHLMASVTMTEGLPETTHWVDSECSVLNIDNLSVSLNNVKRAIQSTFEHIGTLLGQLSQHVTLPPFDRVAYQDSPHVTDIGFNYLKASEAYHKLYDDQYLVNALLCNRDPWGFYRDDQIWNYSAVQKWLDLSDELTQSLYFCFHCGCGQPARGTEEMSIKIINTPEGIRNVFWRGQSFMIRTTYHKGQSMSGHGKNRVTFLPGLLSQHLHHYLAFIRPAQICLLQAVNKLDHVKHLLTHLWVNTSTGLMNTQALSSALQKTFVRHGLAPLGVAAWRHLSVAVCDQWLKEHPKIRLGEDESDDEMPNHVLDIQRNHTSRTANHIYGGTSGFSLDRQSELQFSQASLLWQKFWGIDWDYSEPAPPSITPVIQVSASLLAKQALQRFTHNPSANWKSPFQERWITAILEAKEDLLVVARTGGGKSLGYLLPPLVESNRVTVVIQPLKALGLETMDILAQHHIQSVYIDQVSGISISHQTQVVVVSVEAASQIGFFTAIRAINPHRFIIDEAHQYLDDRTYRNYMAGVARLRSITGQFVFMTGSLAPSKQQELLQGVFNLVQVKSFRESTVRPELLWDIKNRQLRCAADMFGLVLQEWKEGCQSDDESRAMVFIQSHKGVTELAGMLEEEKIPVAYYHAGLDSDVAAAQASKWGSTGRCVMVATCAFGTGINYPHVRRVMVLGIPNMDNINQVFQQAGRAGRDGRHAKVVLVSQHHSVWTPDQLTANLLNPGACPVHTMSSVLDETPSSCLSPGMLAKCSKCAAIGGRPRESTATQGTSLLTTLGVHGQDMDIDHPRLGSLETSSSRPQPPQQGLTLARQRPAPGGLITPRTIQQVPNTNQVHATALLTNKHRLAVGIADLLKRFANCCGWCLGETHERVERGQHVCALNSACFSCRSS
ncbi:ATP-dependent DNA helicase sgs1 [Puccinia graminis f. sp. tritici]|uniref:DNA 3'-5' helicase n=1 Tax=Puccinia graminis f. sp. tritici TaxID=56615 RepID=A0A5B0RT97_PUCGR|nr:ATP-dependent DNA helicase sgs1 [Puccinia graminis f. sp. tritici]